jgi:hypothetical protein
MCRSPNPTFQRLLLGVRELGSSSARVKFDADSQINDKRGTVEFKTKVTGVMAVCAASIAYERAGGK